MAAAGSSVAALPAGFVPRIEVEDPLARHWLGQVTMRLRREIAWLWHERGTLQGIEAGGTLPPVIDPLSEALDLMRYDGDRARFFDDDPTARHLSDRLATVPQPQQTGPRGGFGWLAETMALSPVECFVLALALGGAVDSARGSVIAACQNASGGALPTLALAQRLWDVPHDLLPLLDPAHPLVAVGILMLSSDDWEATLSVPPVVARQLLYPSAPSPEALSRVIPPAPPITSKAIDLAIARLRARSGEHAAIVPLVGPEDGAQLEVAASICQALQVEALSVRGGGDLAALMVVAWLRGTALVMAYGRLMTADGKSHLPILQLPVMIFAAMTPTDPVATLPRRETQGRVALAPLDHAGRLQAWRRALPEIWAGEAGRAALVECARRFHYEARAITRVARAVQALDRTVDRDRLFAACRADLDLGDLAQPVIPRFRLDELMLPRRQSQQIEALVRAVPALSAVHHDWGLARAWNESGLSVLFSGPPGTGKTMAAEAIATEVGMPMYRIDLSQVVNKYIGETEKNLRRLFDAADSGDAILFFDEADALFGKRTEVKDAHDRYANLEVSYLLERMERFKGMAILASNRKKDLDEAFLRRLRAIINFPLPGPEERLRIWRAMMPEGVDHSALDLVFLADRLPLSGGHIRSAVFNACLQSVAADGPARLEMTAVVRAVKDEFDKLGRTVSLDQFGAYAAEVSDEP